jgi:Na+-driven multidrug efflux pump
MPAPNPMTEGPIPSLFFKYYIPALTSVISIALHQVINGIILGQKAGKEALAAVGLYGPVVMFLSHLPFP